MSETMTVSGPYHYEGDLHPSFRVDSKDAIVAIFFAYEGATTEALEAAEARALEYVSCMVNRDAAIARAEAAEAEVVRLRGALERMVAWESAVEICAPDLGGLLVAIYSARATLRANGKETSEATND